MFLGGGEGVAVVEGGVEGGLAEEGVEVLLGDGLEVFGGDDGTDGVVEAGPVFAQGGGNAFGDGIVAVGDEEAGGDGLGDAFAFAGVAVDYLGFVVGAGEVAEHVPGEAGGGGVVGEAVVEAGDVALGEDSPTGGAGGSGGEVE